MFFWFLISTMIVCAGKAYTEFPRIDRTDVLMELMMNIFDEQEGE